MDLKACGVIAEYNPFHQGHAYHLRQARIKSKAQVIVVAMSGNFVQRGEPAIFDKWTRAQVALNHGADLVLEIPTLGCVQSADYFARAGVDILQSANCCALAFGSEGAVADDFYQAAVESKELDAGIHHHLKESQTYKSHAYPMQYRQVVEEHFSSSQALQKVINQPNQLLGLAYTKAILSSKKEMEIIPIARKGAGHNQVELEDKSYASGTSLRKLLLADSGQINWQAISDQLPNDLQDGQPYYEEHYPVSWADFWPILQYILTIKSAEKLECIYQMEFGLIPRFQEAAQRSSTFEDFINQVKTKRWTRTRIQRVSLYCLLSVTQEQVKDYYNSLEKNVIQVLGFTPNGQKYLKRLHHESDATFVTNYAAQKEVLANQYRYDRVFQLANPQKIQEQNIKRIPIRQQSER
ncbi:nucleotidyltransferase [Granulicatella seriolae]|uniref:tRNA(Met) cytidine acetate ligase n=1 Tax=Granulicatella seriolae TaxID=2967226 RepID=A0ABT1WNG4_9LACT|nr:nucleotidyltransferase [Granulicatella seriolae]